MFTDTRPAGHHPPRAARTLSAALISLFAVAASMLLAPSMSAQAAAAAEIVPPRFEAGIAVGNNHACAIGAAGELRCWGLNDHGQLGLGSNTGHLAALGDNEPVNSQPVVDLGAGRRAVAAALGSRHTCVILDTGHVRCWGANFGGPLGIDTDGSHIGDDEPVTSAPVVDLGPGRTAVAIAAGGATTCAILDNGSLRCWGANGEGQLGLGHVENIGDDEPVASVAPVDLGPGRTAAAVAVDGDHTCAILDNGKLRCWGNNDDGQLGLGTTAALGDDEEILSQPSIDLGPGRTAVALSTGDNGPRTCAILDNATLRCWGNNQYGALGIGSTEHLGDDEAITSVPPVALGPGGIPVSVHVGRDNVCTVLTDATLRCWGSDQEGQLAIEGTAPVGDDENPPQNHIPLGGRVISAGSGSAYICAVTHHAEVVCWGDGNYGKTGHGNTDDVGDDEPPTSMGAVQLGFPVRIGRLETDLGLRARPGRDRRAPYVYGVAGRLTGSFPPGRCTGPVTVRVVGKVAVKGSRVRVSVAATLRTRVMATADGCTYRGKVTVRPTQRRYATKRLAGHVRATATYGGNEALLPSKASVQLRLG